jgi:hypothetical protein
MSSNTMSWSIWLMPVSYWMFLSQAIVECYSSQRVCEYSSNQWYHNYSREIHLEKKEYFIGNWVREWFHVWTNISSWTKSNSWLGAKVVFHYWVMHLIAKVSPRVLLPMSLIPELQNLSFHFIPLFYSQQFLNNHSIFHYRVHKYLRPKSKTFRNPLFSVFVTALCQSLVEIETLFHTSHMPQQYPHSLASSL